MNGVTCWERSCMMPRITSPLLILTPPQNKTILYVLPLLNAPLKLTLIYPAAHHLPLHLSLTSCSLKITLHHPLLSVLPLLSWPCLLLASQLPPESPTPTLSSTGDPLPSLLLPLPCRRPSSKDTASSAAPKHALGSSVWQLSWSSPAPTTEWTSLPPCSGCQPPCLLLPPLPTLALLP